MKKKFISKNIFSSILAILISYCSLGFVQVCANEFSYPFFDIDNFSTKQFKGYNQTWGVTQGSDGRIYFANQGGVLIYDGRTWKTIFTKNDAPARSIMFSPNGKVIVGTKGDFGTLIANDEGGQQYASLLSEDDKDIISSSQIVYEITPLSEQETLLRTKNGLYIQSKKGLAAINNPQKFKFGVAKYIDNEIYVYCKNQGMCRIRNNAPEIIDGTQTFNSKKYEVNFLDKISVDEILLVTRSAGIFLLKKGDLRKIEIPNKLLNSTSIYRGIKLRNGNIALATYDGIFILDSFIKPIFHINRSSGLLDDNVRSLFEDEGGNLWAGLNNGISKIKLSAPLKPYPQDFAGINSKTRGMAIFDGAAYIATDVGIKRLASNEGTLRDNFEEVVPNDLKTQVWGLVALDQKLFIASNFGLGKLTDGAYESEIDKRITGRVYQIKLSKYLPKTLIIAAEKGLFIYEPETKDLTNIKLDKGKVWSSQEDILNGFLWAKIIGKGVYKVDLRNYLKKDRNIIVKKYTKRDGLPDDVYRSIFFKYINDQILLGTKYGTYVLDEESDEFINFNGNEHNKEFFKSFIRYAEQLGDEAWVGIVDRSESGRNVSFFSLDKNFLVQPLPLTSLSNEFNFEFYPLDDRVVISSSAGLSVVEKNPVIVNPSGKIIINEALVNNDSFLNGATLSVFHGGDLTLPKKFTYNQNKFNFSIAATDYSNEKEVLFRYKLIGIDDFSNWTKNDYVTYTNLSPGSYKLIIESKNYFGQHLKPFEYEFTITPPWWQTTYFYLAEIAFFLTLLFFTILIKQNDNVQKLATALTFVVIIIIFEYVSMLVDPLILEISGGVPVFALISKIILGVMLQPTEKIASRGMDWCSEKLTRGAPSQ